MALIGNLDSLNHLFYKTQEMQHLYEYLQSTLKDQAIHQRILNTQGEVKIPLKYDMFAIEQSYNLKESHKAMYESHYKYVDFQLAVSGEEFFFVGEKSDFKIQQESLEKDLIVYEPNVLTSTFFFKEKTLAIFLDYDVHAGGLALNHLTSKNKIFKSVVKVPKELVKLKL